jgi:hypothetical protein
VKRAVIGGMKVMPEKRKLAEIERHIADWRKLIASQKKRMADLQGGGHNAAGSITLLRELETSMRSMIDERRAIARRIERLGFRNPQGV